MAKRNYGGFGGGNNMQNMMMQAQRMQMQMQKIQEEVEAREIETVAGGGAVKVVITGGKKVKSIELAPEIVDPDDIEMLQDIIVAAVNQAISDASNMMETEMSKVTGGMNLGGMF